MYPELFKIGSFPVRSYGTLLVVGLLVGLWRATTLCKRRMKAEPEGSPRRIHPDALFDVAVPGLFIGIIGARILYVILHWKTTAAEVGFSSRPGDIFKIWEGGLSLHGGLFLGIVYLVAYCRIKKLSVLAVADVAAPSWAIAYAIGRIGCLLNGCCYGGVCTLPWAIRFPNERYNDPKILTDPSHPAQIYATLFNIAFFFLLIAWEKRSRRDGEIFFGYIALYGFYRYIVEIFRIGGTSTTVQSNIPLSLAQVASLVMIVIGVAAIVWIRKRSKPVADAPLPSVAAEAG